MQYPLNMELGGRSCVVVGGGRVAQRKTATLLFAEADVTVIAPQLTERLAAMAAKEKLRWLPKPYERGCLSALKPFLVFCTTDDSAVNRQAAAEAKSLGALVNAAEQPELSDFTVPASVRRGDVLFTVSTNGRSPALSRQLRQQLEAEFPALLGLWLEHLSALRSRMKQELSTSEARQAFWRRALDKRVLSLVEAGHLDQAEVEIQHAITEFGSES